MSPPLEIGKHPLNESQLVCSAGDHPEVAAPRRSCPSVEVTDTKAHTTDGAAR
jgi:hypothetical protein